MYNGKRSRYKTDAGEATYRNNRQEGRRKIRILGTSDFDWFVIERFRSPENWFLDACVGFARSNKLFARDQMVCARTLYHYVDLGFLPIRNIGLPEKFRRNTKSKKARWNKRILGTSIEERTEIVNARKEFGHCEPDSVLGRKSGKEPCIISSEIDGRKYSKPSPRIMVRSLLFLKIWRTSTAGSTSPVYTLPVKKERMPQPHTQKIHPQREKHG